MTPMPNVSVRLVRLALAALLSACFDESGRPIGDTMSVRVTSPNGRSVRFALDVRGGEARLSAPQMRAAAIDARLVSTTPARVVLEPGVTSASFRALSGERLLVHAVGRRAQLSADGRRVRIGRTARGISIRDY